MSCLSHLSHTATTGSESIRPALEAKAKLPDARTAEDKKHMERLFSSDGTGKDAAAAGTFTAVSCNSLQELMPCITLYQSLVPLIVHVRRC
jgi:DNA-binding sugar fermentation-stimulating protein